jgi:predicted nucleic acid-binding protein
MRIYCDSVILIYFFEGSPVFQTRVMSRLAEMSGAGDSLVTSDMVRLECRMQPIRSGNTVLLAMYDDLFVQPNVEHIPVTAAVFDRATIIRAMHNFKLADSLHLAAAMEGNCDSFPTNDLRLAGFTGLPIEVLP